MNDKIKPVRESNYDFLRVLSMIAVIMIHISGSWTQSFAAYISEGGDLENLLFPIMPCMYNTISRFAVPCFIMLTGAFVLSDSKTANYKEFYQKKLTKIGIPTIIFSGLYILCRIPLCFVGEGAGEKKVIILIEDILKGSPYYHIWYMFMLIGLYLLAPVVIRFKDSIKYENFKKIAFVFLVLGSLSRWTEKVSVNWDIGQSFEYCGYFMVGYVIRKDLNNKKTSKGILLIIAGLLVEIATAFIEYHFQIMNGMDTSSLKYAITSPFSPTIVIASVLIFTGFTMLEMKRSIIIEKLAAMSFIIYLLHAGVWTLFLKPIQILKGESSIGTFNNIYWIPIFVVLVLLVSILLAIIYKKFETFFISKIKKRKGLEQ